MSMFPRAPGVPFPPAPVVAVSQLLGRPVRNRSGRRLGRVHDVVVRVDGAGHPRVAGVVVRVGARRCFVAIEHVVALHARGVELSTADVGRGIAAVRSDELALGRHVLDRQLLDGSGRRVGRVAEAYLADHDGGRCLVGIDRGVGALGRRLVRGRRRGSRRTTAPGIDWASVRVPPVPGACLHLAGPHLGGRS